MERRLVRKTGIGLLVAVLAIILVSGGLLAACSRTQTSTTTTVRPTATSTTTTATTSAASTTTTATTSATSTATTVSAAAKFYKDNVVTITVPYGPGGGVDYAARLFANYWPQVTGGRMIVENKEGANGLLGVNYVYNAKADGLTMGIAIKGSLISQTVSQDPAVKFDMKKMSWIGFTNEGQADGLAVGAKSPYKSVDDLLNVNGLKFGTTGTSTSALSTALILDLLGLKDARIVPGYGSSAEIQLAVGKGEIDGYSMGSDVIKDGAGKGYNKQSFVTLDFVRSLYYPDAPAITEKVKLSPGQESLVRACNALRGGQVYWFQPGAPQDRIDFVRAAFDKIVALEEYKKQSLTRWPIYAAPVSGGNFAAEMEKTLAAATPEGFKALQALVDKYVR